MRQPQWWGESEQMHALLRPAGDQMYDTGKSIPAPLLNSGRVYHKALIDAADFLGAKCGGAAG